MVFLLFMLAFATVLALWLNLVRLTYVGFFISLTLCTLWFCHHATDKLHLVF